MSKFTSERPRLKQHLSVIVHSPDTVEIRDGVWNPSSYTLNDDSASGNLAQVVSMFTGTHTVAEIAATAGTSPKQIHSVLDQLRELRLLEDGSAGALQYYLDRQLPTLLPFGGEPETRFPPPVLLGIGNVAEEVAVQLDRVLTDVAHPGTDSTSVVMQPPDLTEGIGLLDDILAFERWSRSFNAWHDRLVIWASDIVRPDCLQVLNHLSLRVGFPWIHSCIDGPFLLIGPTMIPGRTSCYECLETRLLMNLREATSYQRYKIALSDHRVRQHSTPLNAALTAMLASHTAFEVLNYLTTGNGFTVGKLLAIYLPTMEVAYHRVQRLPNCIACAPPAGRDDHELYFDVRTLLPQNVG